MQDQLLPISQCKTHEHSDSTSQLIREWLLRFGVEYKEDVAPRLPLWLEAFGGMDAALLEKLFSRAFKTCRFFPKVSEILEPIQKTQETAVPEAAEQAWQRVLELRRVYWNPDMPGGFSRGMPKLSERVEQAARAAGVFRDFESVEALHTWAKKRFVEFFTAYGELKQDKFLLPDGEIKNLLTDAAQHKALPAPSVDWADLRERGETYRKKMATDPSQQPDPKRVIRQLAFKTVAAFSRRAKADSAGEGLLACTATCGGVGPVKREKQCAEVIVRLDFEDQLAHICVSAWPRLAARMRKLYGESQDGRNTLQTARWCVPLHCISFRKLAKASRQNRGSCSTGTHRKQVFEGNSARSYPHSRNPLSAQESALGEFGGASV